MPQPVHSPTRRTGISDASARRHCSLSRAVRVGLAAVALVNLGAGIALAFQWSPLVEAWPWPTGRLSYIFVGSILAAVGAGAGWIAWSCDIASLPAGFLNLTVTIGGIAGYLWLATVRGGEAYLTHAVIASVIAAANLALFLRTRRWRTPPSEPLPPLMRVSYAAFTLILLAVGLALVLRAERVMPWPLDADMSVIVGWIFLGDSFYFFYALTRPRWDAARAQLWSFLAYDAVLLGPLLAHYADAGDLQVNVVVYSTVLVYSAGLAVFYLLLNRRTRGW